MNRPVSLQSLIRGIAVGVVTSLSALAASATSPLFTNLGPSESFDQANGTNILGANSGADFYPAYSFVAEATGSVGSIELAVSTRALDGFEPRITVLLMTAAPYDGSVGNPHLPPFTGTIQPGSVLGAWSVTGVHNAEVVAIENLTELSLSEGATYFLRLVPDGPTSGTWWSNATGHVGTAFACAGAAGCGYNSESVTGAFRISVTGPIPEPSAAALLVVGLVAVAAIRRRGAA